MLSSRPDLPLKGISIKYVLSLKYRSTSAYLMDNLLNWMRIRFQQIENDQSDQVDLVAFKCYHLNIYVLSLKYLMFNTYTLNQAS